MCGIIGIHFKNTRDLGIAHEKLEDLVDEMLLGIEHRGRDATGLLTVSERGKPNLVKADVDAETFIRWREPVPKRVRTILGHTRFATQGKPENLDNNHPVEFGTCFAIHNGHISNDTELFAEFSLDRRAEVDSEIIPALFDKFGLDKAHLALQELDGGFATAVVDPVRFPNMTVLAKGWSSPCEVLETKHAVIWASVPEAIVEAADKVLGFKPALSKIETLKVGDILLMEGETVERLSFKPKVRSYTSTRSSCSTSYSYSAPKTLSSNPREGRLYDECKSCGCSRLWHGTVGDFTGSCKHTQPGGVYPCRCIGFVEPTREAIPLSTEDLRRGKAWEYCDSCGRSFFEEDLTLINNSFICGNCTRKPIEKPQALDVRQRAEDVLLRQQMVADEFNISEVSDIAWEAREEAVNEHVCAMAAEKCGMAANYVNWLVNECTPSIRESDSTGYLGEAVSIAGKAYFNAWSQLDDEIREIEEAAWREGLEQDGSNVISIESIIDEEVLA